MNAIARALQEFLAARPAEVPFALVGGVAVSARSEPRFTRDLDFAIAVADDVVAAGYVFELRQHGYEVQTAIEQSATGRLSTVRLRRPGSGPVVDLLFASSGIEDEIVAAANEIEVAAGIVAPVAQVGHLIAMKLLSRDDRTRPRDREDLVQLAAVADDAEWRRAEQAVTEIARRGFARGRDLVAALGEWRRR
jgi:hypothetical protein